uniref:Coiled-coil domain-containing protein 75 n=1 Tax=Aegilops tauschii TaxID=37682 RepID=N1R0M2_AEGTA
MEPNAAVEADAEDDYMGDLSHFLPPSPSSPTRSLGVRKQPPKPAPPARGQAKRAKGLPWKERRRKERERIQREEDARTLAGMAEAIPESNVGFKMLKQMGYDPAARGAGTEPVGIEIRRSRAGLGAEPDASVALLPQLSEPKTREEEERDRKREEEMVAELRSRKSTQWKGRRLVWDYRKAEAALAQLENREVEPPAPDGEEEEKGEDEEEEVITEEDCKLSIRVYKPYWISCVFNTTIAFTVDASLNQQEHWQMNALGLMKMITDPLCQCNDWHYRIGFFTYWITNLLFCFASIMQIMHEKSFCVSLKLQRWNGKLQEFAYGVNCSI